MKTIKFLGAAGTVTGSSFLLTDDTNRYILIDFGLFQGTDEEKKLNYHPIGFDIKLLSGVILTHAHLDHCGGLPLLVKRGYTGDIYATKATKLLAELVLLDAAHVQMRDKEFEPLYNEKDVLQTIEQFQVIDYDAPFQIGGSTVVLRDAGHILGSASIEIADKNASDVSTKTVFSGDLGNSPEDLLKPTELIRQADTVIMESTYGDKTHGSEIPIQIIREEINTIERSGGVLLIPAFSLERTQEILYMIDRLKKQGYVKNETPVFLDSPMAIRATAIYEQFPNLYNERLALEAAKNDPFMFPGLTMVEDGEESRRIEYQPNPKVIIAGSGMMNGGRILRHALQYLPMPSTRLLIVGYQAEDTLGRQIQEGIRTITIEGHEIELKASVRETSSMSAHADQPKLLKWISAIRGVKRVFLVHGEDTSRKALAEKIHKDLNINDIILPSINQEELVSAT